MLFVGLSPDDEAASDDSNDDDVSSHTSPSDHAVETFFQNARMTLADHETVASPMDDSQARSSVEEAFPHLDSGECFVVPEGHPSNLDYLMDEDGFPADW